MTTLWFALLGAKNVGKSMLKVRYVEYVFVDEYDPTIESGYRKQVTIDGRTFSLSILDPPPDGLPKETREKTLKEQQGFIFVFSLTSLASFESVKVLCAETKKCSSEDIPIVLVGTKLDLEDERQVSKEMAEALARDLGCPFIESSAKTDTNVTEVFETMIRLIAAKLAPVSSSSSSSSSKKCIVQ